MWFSKVFITPQNLFEFQELLFTLLLRMDVCNWPRNWLTQVQIWIFKTPMEGSHQISTLTLFSNSLIVFKPQDNSPLYYSKWLRWNGNTSDWIRCQSGSSRFNWKVVFEIHIYFSSHWFCWNIRTILHLTIQNGDIEMATNMIESGANLDLQDSSGR